MSNPSYWPFIIYVLGVLFMVGFMIGLSYLLGERHKGEDTDLPFESGVQSTGGARVRFSAKFYLVAMLFVIFDLEVVFIFAWAISAKALGWPAYFVLLIFVFVLAVGLIYEWRVGALDWVSTKDRFRKRDQGVR